MPCLISASTLFCVETRGVESTRPLPVVSSADSATSRLNAPLIDPSCSPTALVAPWHRQIDGRRRAAVASRARARRRAIRCSGTRGSSCCRAPDSTLAVESPLDAERALEILVDLDDPRFDLDLRLRPVERRDQARSRSSRDPEGP